MWIIEDWLEKIKKIEEYLKDKSIIIDYSGYSTYNKNFIFKNFKGCNLFINNINDNHWSLKITKVYIENKEARILNLMNTFVTTDDITHNFNFNVSFDIIINYINKIIGE